MIKPRPRRRPPGKPPSAPRVKEPRRALSHVGGGVEVETDDPDLGELLTRALEVEPDESATLAHVHGFHSYPARLHPETAARLIEGLSRQGDCVLDPFCGSGTVLIEAQQLARAAIGVDANPLAIALARLRTRKPEASWAAELSAAAARVVEQAESRRKAKAGPTKRYGPQDRELFDIHVLLELDGLQSAIREEQDDVIRRSLLLVLSATLTKVSRRTGDSSSSVKQKRIAGGFTIRFFGTRALDLVDRVLDYRTRIPPEAPEPDVMEGDARQLGGVTTGTVAAIVTSPPYPGVYDYLAHHAARLRWLGMDQKGFAATEIGARRQLGQLDFSTALRLWKDDFGRVLSAFSRCLAPSGRAALVLGDSTLAGRPVHADRIVQELCPGAGLTLLGAAAQTRPHFHFESRAAFRDRARREHVLVVGKAR